MAITANRSAFLLLDVPTTVKTSSLRDITRSGDQLATAGVDKKITYNSGTTLQNSQNAEIMPVGTVRVKPYHADLSNPHELNTTATANSALTASDLMLAGNIVSKPMFYNKSDYTGLTPAASVATTGDYFFQKTVASGANWTGSDLAGDRVAYGNPQNTNFPMERHGITKSNMPADGELCVRFMLPGTGVQVPDVVKIFYFGAPVDRWGHGAYAIAFRSDGLAQLYDRIGYMPYDASAMMGSAEYVGVWRYAGQHRTTSTSICMRIIPHLAPDGGGYIVFSQDSQAATGSGRLLDILAQNAANAITFHVHRIVNRTYYDPSNPTVALEGPQPSTVAPVYATRNGITAPGKARIDVRADQRTSWQILQAKYPASGYFIDEPIDFPDCSPSTPLILSWIGVYPNSTDTITGTILDATTGATLTQTSSGDQYAVFTPNAGVYHYRVRFDFATDGMSTPTLWSYKIAKQAYGENLTPTLVNIPNSFSKTVVTQYSITGSEGDMSHETASINVEDPLNECSMLGHRQLIPAALCTTYDPADSTKFSVLWRGEIGKAVATRKGRPHDGVDYPSPFWKSYVCECSGIWARLARQMVFDRIMLAPDPDSPNGDPYKVTDICRQLLQSILGNDQVDIPDNDRRFFPGQQGDEGLMIAPGTEILDVVSKYLREYLGWRLVPDYNAGTNFMIRAIPPPVPTSGSYRVMCTLTTDAPSGSGIVYPLDPGAWNAADYVVHSNDNKSIPIIGNPENFIKPAEANAVFVTGTGEVQANANTEIKNSQFAFNTKSYDAIPGKASAVVDADYYPEQWPLIVYRMDITSQEQADLLTRRYYDQSCHSKQMLRVRIPLVLVWDDADTLQSNPRPLRYYDAVDVKVNGTTYQYLVRNCNIEPMHSRDQLQTCILELEHPVLTGTVGQEVINV